MAGHIQVYRGKQRWTFYVIFPWRGEKHVYTRDGRGDRFESEAHARRFLECLSAEVDRLRGRFDPEKWKDHRPYALKNYRDRWLGHYERLVEAGQISPSTLREKVRCFDAYLIPLIGDVNIQEINAGVVEDFLARLPEHLAPKTMKNILADLHAFMMWLYRREEVERVPPFPRVRVNTPRIRWMSDGDWRQVYEHIPAHHRPIFHFLRTYGCRIGEARALKWRDVDNREGTFVIRRTWSSGPDGEVLRERAKSGSNRTLPILPGTLPRPSTIVNLEGFVFTRPGGQPYTGNGIRMIWRKAAVASGVKYVSLYQATRHSFGCRKVAEGYSLEENGAVLGRGGK